MTPNTHPQGDAPNHSLAVTQADRDAAADLADKLEFELAIGGNDLAAIRNGIWDNVASSFGSIVQAFARHRHSLGVSSGADYERMRALLAEARELLRASQFNLRIDMAARNYHERVEGFLPRIDAALKPITGTDTGQSEAERVKEAARADAFDEAAKIALSHSNYGHVEGNRRAFTIVDDIRKRAAAIRSMPTPSPKDSRP